MNLFRSEEHVRRWGDRLDPDWKPRTREENQAILTAVGLTDQFWRLPST
jgi:hypothetical protein